MAKPATRTSATSRPGRDGKGGKPVRPIVIRREEVAAAAHHGGAWKVAYADFVTAMMAFFLLMWLINATTEKQRRGLADYFSPNGPVTRATSGSGKPFGGLTPNESGSLVSNRGYVSNTDQTGRPPAAEQPVPTNPSAPAQRGAANFPSSQTDSDAIPIDGDSNQPGASGRADADQDNDSDGDNRPPDNQSARDVRAKPPVAPADAVQHHFDEAAASIRRALATGRAGDAGKQVAVDVTPDELRIQIYDAAGKPMFDPDATEPNDRARRILAEVAPVLGRLGEPISIVGHTDASACLGHCRSNWDLSAARADATRATLVAAGMPDRLVAGVAGLADHDPLLPAQPDAAANRRVVLVVHRQAPGILPPP